MRATLEPTQPARSATRTGRDSSMVRGTAGIYSHLFGLRGRERHEQIFPQLLGQIERAAYSVPALTRVASVVNPYAGPSSVM